VYVRREGAPDQRVEVPPEEEVNQQQKADRVEYLRAL